VSNKSLFRDYRRELVESCRKCSGNEMNFCYNHESEYIQIECENCKHLGPIGLTPESAIRLWNIYVLKR
jgi:hypothetical protein